MTLSEDLKKPFNKITLALAIISIGLSIILYDFSTKEKEISFQINEPTSLIFDFQNSSNLIKLIQHDTLVLKENVYLLTGVIWNSGDASIKNEDVRKDLCFALNEANKILDYNIISQTEEVESGFEMKKIDDNNIHITWKYFDAENGFRFQILYSGNPDPEFTVNGKFLDLKQIKKQKKSAFINNRFDIVMYYLEMLTFFVLIYLILYKYYYVKEKSYKPYFTILIILIFLAIIIIKDWESVFNSPPL